MGRVFPIAGLVLAGWIGAAPAATSEYEAAKKTAFTAPSGFAIANSDQSVAALQKVWSILGDRALVALRAHSRNSGKMVHAAIAAFDPTVEARLTRLSPPLSLLQLQAGEVGGVFLIAGTGHDAHIVWTPSLVDLNSLQKFPLLAAYLPRNARADCERRAPYGAGGKCGPLYAAGGALPSDSRGRARFYLNATYAQMAGMGVSAQISVWQWDGKTAEPLLVVPYDYMIEDAGVRLAGNRLLFRQKDEYNTAYVNAPDVGKQMDGVIRIDPEGIRYLGLSPLIPELAFADDAMWASIEGKPTDAFMSRQTAMDMAALFRPVFPARSQNASPPWANS